MDYQIQDKRIMLEKLTNLIKEQTKKKKEKIPPVPVVLSIGCHKTEVSLNSYLNSLHSNAINE